jgi:hypothetical protein
MFNFSNGNFFEQFFNMLCEIYLWNLHNMEVAKQSDNLL